MSRFLAFAAALVLIGGALAARSAPTKRALPSSDATEIAVPHVKGAIVLDGDLDDPGWLDDVARSGGFLDKDGNVARPYSEARLTWGDGVLYLSLYAADEDIRGSVANGDGPVWRDDEFHFVIDDGTNERSFDVSVNGIITDGTRVSATGAGNQLRAPTDFSWNSGTHVSREIDGTLNAPSDDDEEWALEVAIPLASIGLDGEPGERVRFAIHRCDSPKKAARTCASWGERKPLVLVLR